MSKKTITTAVVAMAFAATVFSNNTIAQQTRALIQGQPKAQIQQHGGTQRLLVDPGFQHSKPRLGFQGRMIYNYGMKVVSVNWGSPAKQVGLEAGDIIKKINGRFIRTQWDYDQALIDAANFNNGRVSMLVRNVRYDWGYHVPKFVRVHAVLDGFGGGWGPVGPQVAARKF